MYNGGHIQKCKEQLELAYKWPIFCSIATYWGHRKVRRDVWGHNVAFCTVAIQRVSKRHLENYYVWFEIYRTRAACIQKQFLEPSDDNWYKKSLFVWIIRGVATNRQHNLLAWIRYVTMIKSELRNRVVRLAFHLYFRIQRPMSYFFDTFFVTDAGVHC